MSWSSELVGVSSGALDWATSGAMALTGRRDGAPRLAPGDPAGATRAALARLGLRVPGLLGERGAYAGLRRSAPASCGGAMRILRTSDGHVALSLPRTEDLDLVPALIEDDPGPDPTDPWPAVAAWVHERSAADASARIRLLGLAGGAVEREAVPARPASHGTPGSDAAPLQWAGRPTVVDLTALWAGPLAGHLLALRGARVIKVESRHRPDGARRGAPGFFTLLNGVKESLVLDLPADVATLRGLLRSADVVLESSRPRALRHWGIDAEEYVADGTGWVSITARGRDADAIGFGDDVAACAGLVLRDDDPRGDGTGLVPVGDALADPMSGVAAAVAAAEMLQEERAALVDVAMLDVCRAARGSQAEPVEHVVERRGEQWWLETATGAAPVADPVTREAAR